MSAPSETFAKRAPLGTGVEIIQELPCGLIAFSKPAGVLSHPNTREDEDRSLLQARYSLEDECYQWTEEASAEPSRLWLLNRLDSATSGVILGASNEDLAAAIRDQFKRKRIHKTYYAVVFGAPSVPMQVWRDRLAVEKRGGQVRTSAAGNIPCECSMRLLRRSHGQPLLSILQLDPRTGRSHQLRVQCALHKLPIVGDATYGDFSANRRFAGASGFKRLFLHSYETHFDFEFENREYRFHARAPLPRDFDTALKSTH